MKIKKAVIPAAGYGTRMLPASKAVPKEMINIYNKPSIQYVVEEAVNSGISDIIIITSTGKTDIANHFDKNFDLEEKLKESGKMELYNQIKNISNLCNIYFKRQILSKGLADAIMEARSFVGEEPFAVLLPDDITYGKTPAILELIEEYEKRQSIIVGAKEVSIEDASKYGICFGEKVDEKTLKLKDMIEKPTKDIPKNPMAALGRYVLDKDIFPKIENLKKGKNDEYQLTDAIKALCKEKDVFAYDFYAKRYDAGNVLGALKASIEFGLRDDSAKLDLKKYIIEISEKLKKGESI